MFLKIKKKKDRCTAKFAAPKLTKNLFKIFEDEVRYASIFDVIVDTQYQSKGLGKLLVEKILAHTKLANTPCITLYCLEDKVGFYEKCGFEKNFDNIIPMRLKKKKQGYSMNKLSILMISLIFLHSSCFAMVAKKAELCETYAEKAGSLKAIAEHYRKFLSQFGQEEPGDLLPTMKTLFAPDIKKFVNTCHSIEGITPVATTIEELHAQICAAKKDLGIWCVLDEDLPIVCVEENMVISHLAIPTQKKGIIVVMKKLTCDNKGLIKEINEVFNFKSRE